MTRENLYPNAARLADEIEAEMKAIGVWRGEALPEAAYQFRQAFAADTMTFTQWLQYVLLPRVRLQILSFLGTPDNSTTASCQSIFGTSV